MRNLLIRSFRSFEFWIAVFLGIAGMASFGSYAFFNGEYLAQNDVLYWVASAFMFGLAKLFLPFISALPILSFSATDYESGYLFLSLHRCGKKRFVMKRMSAAFFSGAAAALIGLLLYMLYIALRCPLFMDTGASESVRQVAEPLFREWLHEQPCGWPYLLTEMICLGITAGTWSLIALGVSNLSHSTIQVIGLVFFLHYMISWGASGTPFVRWSPMKLQSPTVVCTDSLSGIGFRLMVWLLLAVLFAGLSEIRVMRRLCRKGTV